MSSLVTQMIVAERYGLRLRIEQLATLLDVSKGSIYNQLSAGTFPVPTYLDGKLRFADYRDVAAYLDDCRARAKLEAA